MPKKLKRKAPGYHCDCNIQALKRHAPGDVIAVAERKRTETSRSRQRRISQKWNVPFGVPKIFT